MSLGRQKNRGPKPPKIQAPPQVKSIRVGTPTGDLYESTLNGGVQTNRTTLSANSQSLLNTSQTQLNQLAESLGTTDSQRARQIQDRENALYTQSAQGINRAANDNLSTLQGNLVKQFGSSKNSTFGNDLIARSEDNRLNRLADAQRQASLLSEDLYQKDEDSKIRRANTFFNFINNYNNDAQGLAQSGTNALLSENRRVSDIAVNRAKMLQDYYDNLAITRNTRQSSLRRNLPTATALLGGTVGLAFGQPLLGANIGRQLGSFGQGFA